MDGGLAVTTYNILLLCGGALILIGMLLLFRKNQYLIKALTTLTGLGLLYPGILLLIREIKGDPRTTAFSIMMVIFSWIVLIIVIVYKTIEKYRAFHQAP